MSGPDPTTAAVRSAVRVVLAECDPGDLVLVACSGGADSLALAAATAFEAPRLAMRYGAVVVDHALQRESATVAADAAETCRALGFEPVDVARVEVPGTAQGLEAAARSARYEALEAAAELHGARLLLLGHTLDDQAEQVLLGLTRGAGARSLAGMPRARGRLRRPLLGIPRSATRRSVESAGLAWWDDPMNEDPSFTRVRARRALADLERDLGPGVTAALARSADLLRDDADELDHLAEEAVTALGPGPWDVAALAELPRATRTRVWRRLALAAGAPAGQLSTRHTEACDALLTRWHGQGPVSLPGPLHAVRSGGRVSLAPPAPVE
ncbi:tRNA lysidine(34) synthetase TilS [Pedococcus sp. 5OH_020]|uniref:tRNA lysidine(34) synthetase TilS n=1 Tax=Pedococcus sp. 5OH_020 TaxID=2989814 RepID=UPI0022E9CD67|nr:tRNA lysidine(34) synthetase TilS [Pedococcus sp. 5OH_020]